LEGKKLLQASIRQPAILKTVNPPLSEISGKRLVRVERIGKHLAFQWNSGVFLVTHLMLTGWMKFCADGTGFNKHDEFALSWEDGQDLRIYETGRECMVAVYLVSHPQEVPAVARTGIDPLGGNFTAEVLAGLLTARRETLKTFLTKPEFVSGIGNAFSNEILFAAKLSPYAIPANLSPDETESLYLAIRKVLFEATAGMRERVGGRFPRKADREGFLRVHNREGQACPVCGSTIAAIWKGKSGTFYCPGVRPAARSITTGGSTNF
jgi:formamidopyrimidine-DNA glycosylase